MQSYSVNLPRITVPSLVQSNIDTSNLGKFCFLRMIIWRLDVSKDIFGDNAVCKVCRKLKDRSHKVRVAFSWACLSLPNGHYSAISLHSVFVLPASSAPYQPTFGGIAEFDECWWYLGCLICFQRSWDIFSTGWGTWARQKDRWRPPPVLTKSIPLQLPLVAGLERNWTHRQNATNAPHPIGVSRLTESPSLSSQLTRQVLASDVLSVRVCRMSSWFGCRCWLTLYRESSIA